MRSQDTYLNENGAVRVVRVEPVLDIRDKLLQELTVCS